MRSSWTRLTSYFVPRGRHTEPRKRSCPPRPLPPRPGSRVPGKRVYRTNPATIKRMDPTREASSPFPRPAFRRSSLLLPFVALSPSFDCVSWNTPSLVAFCSSHVCFACVVGSCSPPFHFHLPAFCAGFFPTCIFVCIFVCLAPDICFEYTGSSAFKT